MKLINILPKLLFFTFVFSSLTTFADDRDSSKPVKKINREFLVIAHIVLTKDSAELVSPEMIEQLMIGVNQIFAPIEAKFKICEYKRIYNFNFNISDDTNRPETINQYMIPNRINMFFVANIPNACGNAELGGLGWPHAGIFIGGGQCTNTTTIAHELGHFFSLPHTFEGAGTELADGSNCKTSGDFICDTPADPYDDKDKEKSNKFVDKECLFISDKKDAKGNYYDPDVSNIMGYYSQCRCMKFTTGQYNKMANYYLMSENVW